MSIDARPSAPPGYELVRAIGWGTGSVVWQALQLSTRRPTALKIVDVEPADAIALDRFMRERGLVGPLGAHHHVLTVYDAGIHDGRPWLATELCHRGSLADYTAVHGPLATGPALAVLASVASAVGAAHRTGLTHGGISASNLLLTDAGQPVLDDLGLYRTRRRRAGVNDVIALGATIRELCGERAAMLPDPVSALLDAAAAGWLDAATVADQARALQRTLSLDATECTGAPFPPHGVAGGSAQAGRGDGTRLWIRGAHRAAAPAEPAATPGTSSRRRTAVVVGSVVAAVALSATGAVGVRTLAAHAAPAQPEPVPTDSVPTTGVAPPAALRATRSPVRVLNNTAIPKLAARAAADFQSAGWTVQIVGNYVSRTIPWSTVYYRPGTSEEQDAANLADAFGLHSAPVDEQLLDAPPGLMVVLARDYRPTR